MHAPPVLAALRKHISGVVLISLEIALTLAIVCNAAFIIGHRIERTNRATGLDESNLILVTQQWVNVPAGSSPAALAKLDSMQLEDLAVLRRLPGVADAAPINSVPILGGGMGWPLARKPDATFKDSSALTSAAIYQTDDHGLATLGLKLVAGRNFRAGDVGHQLPGSMYEPVIILTQAMAHEMFPHGHAIGQNVYFAQQGKPSRVIGIVARMQTPFAAGGDKPLNSVILPQRDDLPGTMYVVRASPGHMAVVMKAIQPALFKANPMRVMPDGSVTSFATIRARAYKGDVGMAIVMGVISLILIAMTGAGIMGLTSFWVGQRRKQIGVRRALGATRSDIARYFQVENLIIAGAGCVLGIIMAVGLNLVLMQHMAMPRLPIWVVLVAVVFVLILGQIAVFVPARRAAKVSPATATLSV